MPSKVKTSRRETTPVERAIVWTYYCNGLLYSQIVIATWYYKSTVASIIQRIKKSTGTDKFTSAKHCRVPQKVNPRREQALIWHADQNTRDFLAVLGIPLSRHSCLRLRETRDGSLWIVGSRGIQSRFTVYISSLLSLGVILLQYAQPYNISIHYTCNAPTTIALSFLYPYCPHVTTYYTLAVDSRKYLEYLHVTLAC
jgi:hypothetical protein